MSRLIRALIIIFIVAFIVILPIISPKRYFIHIGALTGIYIILALSFDLVVGQVGALSFAHPAFFGIGAYVAAILSTNFGTSLIPNIVLGALLVGLIAIIIGIPSFRLSRYSFAMGTLGIALVAQLIAKNWYTVTNGPLCISQIPNASIGFPGIFHWESDSLTDDYYLIIALVGIVFLIVRRLISSRLGRAFKAIREDEILASSRSMNPLFYKMTAFIASGMLASIAGVLFAHYIAVVCPTVLAIDITVTLLIIEFLGGAGNIPGIILGAVLFTAIPEYLRIAASARPLIYGAILMIIIVYAPEGLGGWVEKVSQLIGQSTSSMDRD